MLSACQTAKLEVIAEGVESWEQYIKLKELGVRFFQGYLFSKPHIVPSM
ncbi:TPA: EAL domain-containing protein [Vibrio parahaemolyticus]